ncbi:MAG: rod shape-determining protein MreC [Lachnospiraceae bacterium]|nr:rod shape-determining protein MreC [Lachnospiraceae bacterium]
MNKLFGIEFPPRRILFIMTIVCLALMAVTYFMSDSAVPVRTAFGYLVVPLQTGMNFLGNQGAEAIDQRISMNELLETNQKLTEENAALRAQLALNEQKMHELGELRGLLEMKESYPDYEMTGATIISSTSENWFYRFTVNKGRLDGIEPNMVVVHGNGLVGIVTSVGDHHAAVTSIIDDTMNVAAIDLTTGSACIVRGDTAGVMDNGTIQIRYIDNNDEIRVGDAITTSNLSKYYLPDILIGYVSEVEQDPNMLTKSGRLIPAVDFSTLDEVLIIKTLKEK